MNQLSKYILLLILVVQATSDCFASTIFVAPNGNDRWTGEKPDPNVHSNDGPKASLLEAIKQIRTMRAAHSDASSVYTIILRGGTYQIEDTIDLTPSDSGTDKASLVITGQTNEVPILAGGVRLTQGKLKGGQWSFRIDPTTGQTPSQLYVNGLRRQRVRMPKRGYYYIADSNDLNVPYTQDQFVYYLGDMRSDSNCKDLIVRAFHAWNVYTLQVSHIDPTHRVVTFNTPMAGRTRVPLDRKIWYVVENDSAAKLDVGEWYFNAGTRELRYNPEPGESLDQSEVIAGKIERILELQGSSIQLKGSRIYGTKIENIEIRNVTFAYTNWVLPKKGLRPTQGATLVPGAVEVGGAHNVSISNCVFKETGGSGLVIGADVHHFAVRTSQFRDVGAGGLRIGSFDERDLTYPAQWTDDGEIVGNLISGYGQVHPDACGIMSGLAGNIKIVGNNISDGYYTGISVGWDFKYGVYAATNNIIRGNQISDIGQSVMSDMGGIYTLGEQPGTQITDNVVTNVKSARYGAWGIYLDEASSSILVANNLVFNIGSAAIHLHWGRDVIIEKNILAFGKDCIFENTDEGRTGHYTFRSNVLLADRVPFFGKYGILPGTDIHDNDYVSSNASSSRTPFPGTKDLIAWRAVEPNAESEDPAFRNPTTGDFEAANFHPLAKRGINLSLFVLPVIGRDSDKQPERKIWWDPAPPIQAAPTPISQSAVN